MFAKPDTEPDAPGNPGLRFYLGLAIFIASFFMLPTGLVMFFFPFIPNYIMAYAPHLFSDDYLVKTIIHAVFDVVFISGLFVLGGDFWDKLRSLFFYTAKAKFDEGAEVLR